MTLWTIGLLFLCVCGQFLWPVQTAPVRDEDDGNERSLKRELELFEGEVQDNWEHEDSEYLSKKELLEAREKKNEISDNADKEDADDDEKDDKRWLDVDANGNGLPKEDRSSPADDEALPKDGELFEQDIVMDSFVRAIFNGEAQKRDAVNREKYYWPEGKVHYNFDENIDPISKMQILHAIEQYKEYTCIKFEKCSENCGGLDYVHFISNGSRCYSNVGRRGGKQVVSIGSGCYRIGTPIHEIKHVLGFFHEMARPDRDKYVRVHWENIKRGLRHNFRKIPKSLNLNLVKRYNVNSVMHYSNDAFSMNNKPTITDRDDPSRTFGQRSGFSVGDIMEINRLYNCRQFNERLLHLDPTCVLCKHGDTSDYCDC